MITQVSPEKRPCKTVLADKPDYLLCGAFVALWLVPISWVGVANQSLPQAGKFLGNQYQIAALFTNRVPHWIEFYIEVQIGNEWVSSPQSHYSSIKMSGEKTRFDRMLSDWFPRKSLPPGHGMAQRQKMAQFVRQRHHELFPELGPVSGVRFVYVLFPSSERLASEKHSWYEWPLERISKNNHQVFSTHFFDGRPPVDREGQPHPKALAGRK